MSKLTYDDHGLRATRNLGGAGAVLALVVLAAASCGPLEISGSKPGNEKPELILVDIPVGGQLLGANPTVYWYGTDVDGRVVRYDYAVVPETAVTLFLQQHNSCSEGSSDADKYIRCGADSMPWVSIFVDSSVSTLPTQQQVPLYASFDTLDCDSQIVRQNVYDENGNVINVRFVTLPTNCVCLAVPQYMFIRAVDDQGAESQIKYRSFLRENHWPETAISSSFNPWQNYFSIPNLTETYTGIELRWNGSDRGDFLRDQPVLTYHWRVYGPYPLGQGTREDRPELRDTLQDGVPWVPVQESQNVDSKLGVWVTDTIATVYDLWRKVDEGSNAADTTRSGYFLFVVQSRDDASVSDPTPAFTTFEAVYPKFERKLLVVDETAYGISPGGYPSWDPNRRDYQGQKKDSNQAFLYRIARLIDANINGAHDAWTPERDFWERMDQRVWCNQELARCSTLVPLPELSRHEVVLYIDDDFSKPITTDPSMRVPLAQYLDIGGKLWLVSRVGFLNGTDIGATTHYKLHDFLTNGNYFPTRYFGIAGMYFAGWSAGVSDIPPHSNDEFIAANAISSNDPGLATPAELPARLDVDTARVSVHWLPLRAFLGTDVVRGVPNVGYVIRWTDETRAPATRPLYLFESWRPGLSPADQRLVAVRAVGPTMQVPKYKTAFMGCPLWFFQENEEQIYKYVKGMTDWFYNQPIESGP